jgi:hypothetical protein
LRRHRLHLALIAAASAALCVVVPPGRALADKAPRVGVVVSVQVNLNKSEVQKISQALGRALRQRLVVDVVAGPEAIRRLPADGVSESCVVDESCIKDAAQRLTADELLFLVAVRVGNRIQVDSTWVDPANGRSASRPKVVMIKLDEAEARFADAASLILPDAAVRPTQQVGDGPDDRAGGEVSAVVIRTTPRHMTIPAWATGGLALAAAGTSVGFFLVTRNDYGQLEDQCARENNCDSPMWDPLKDKIDRNAITADILAGAAVVSAAATFVLWWTSGGDIERVPVGRALRLQVDPTTRGTMVLWEGNL